MSKTLDRFRFPFPLPARIRTTARATVLTIAVLATFAVPALPGTTTAPDLRATLGVDKMPGDGTALILRGDGTFLGTDARITVSLDAGGRIVENIDGPVAQLSVFDGENAWEVDWNGIRRTLVLGDRDDLMLRDWFATGLWLLAPEGAKVDWSPDDGVFTFDLRGDGRVATISLDESTGLPDTCRYDRSGIAITVALSDYREANGIMLPHLVETRSAIGDETTFRVHEVKTGKANFAPTPGLEHKATFDPSIAPGLELRTAPTGHLMVRGRVNDTDAGWFIFDTGAGENVISTKVARELGLDSLAAVPMTGVGGSFMGPLFRAASMTVGPVTMKDPVMAGIDLAPFEPVFGVKLGGIVGYGVLSSAVVEYDIATPSISLYDPATYELEAGKWQDVLLYERTAHVHASFEGHDGVFLLDTGAANGTVGIYAPATEALGLLDDRETTTAMVGGAGGSLPARSGTAAWFELGNQRFDSLTAIFATERKGAYGDTYITGSVGGKVLKNFTLVFDYGRGRMAFIPREAAE